MGDAARSVTLHGEWLMANGVADRAALDAIQDELHRGNGRRRRVRGERARIRTPSKVDQDIYA